MKVLKFFLGMGALVLILHATTPSDYTIKEYFEEEANTAVGIKGNILVTAIEGAAFDQFYDIEDHFFCKCVYRKNGERQAMALAGCVWFVNDSDIKKLRN